MKLLNITMAIFLLNLLLPFEVEGAEAKEGISGKVYYRWSYLTASDADPPNEFSLDRLYFTYAKHLWEGINLILTSDIYYDGHLWTVYQKYAYLQWHTGMGDLLIGLQGMNIFNITESNWGYRFLAKSSMDKHKFASSADMGLGYARSIGKMTHLHFTVTNGGGYKAVEKDKFKKLAGQVVFGTKDLTKHTGFNAGLATSIEPYESADTTRETKTVLALFGAFANKSLQIGGEFDRLTDNAADSDTTQTYTNQQIVAVYVDYRVTAISGLNMNIFGRVESFDHDLDTDNDGELSIIAGVNIRPIQAFSIAPNIRYSIPEDKEHGESGLTAFQLNFEFKF